MKPSKKTIIGLLDEGEEAYNKYIKTAEDFGAKMMTSVQLEVKDIAYIWRYYDSLPHFISTHVEQDRIKRTMRELNNHGNTKETDEKTTE